MMASAGVRLKFAPTLERRKRGAEQPDKRGVLLPLLPLVLLPLVLLLLLLILACKGVRPTPKLDCRRLLLLLLALLLPLLLLLPLPPML